MYFISKQTKSSDLIGIHENNVYAWRLSNGIATIFRKSIFDAGHWEIICKKNLIKLYNGCSDFDAVFQTLRFFKLAFKIINSNIWGVGCLQHAIYDERTEEYRYRFWLYSIDCDTKVFTSYRIQKAEEELFDVLLQSNTNYVIRSAFYNENEGSLHFTLCPDYVCGSWSVPIINFVVNEKEKRSSILSWKLVNVNPALKQIGFAGNTIFGIDSKNNFWSFNGGQKIQHDVQNFAERVSENELVYSDDCLFLVTRCHSFSKNNELIQVKEIEVGEDGRIFNSQTFVFYVDKRCPSFQFSDISNPRIFLAPNLILFSAKENRIVTAMNRPLTLSESAYLTLVRTKFPIEMQIAKVEKGIFERWRGWIWRCFSPRKKPEEMSLKYIQQILNLPKPLELYHG